MSRLALGWLRLDASRSVLSVAGIAAVLAVMLLLQGVKAGLATQLRSVALDRGADLIAVQPGVSNIVGARSVLPQLARGEVEAVAGVLAAEPMTTLPLIHERDGRRTPLLLLIADTTGVPRAVEEGRVLEGEGEILIDRSLARIHGLSVGEQLEIAGYSFLIVGVVEATAALWTPLAFTNYDTLIEFYFEADLADDLSAFPLLGYLLIRLDEGTESSGVREAIEAGVPAVDVYGPEQIADNDERLGRTMLGAVLDLLIGIAWVVGLTVVGLFMFTAAEGRRRDIGVLKAIGFPARMIVGGVLAEALIVVLVAAPAGVALARVGAELVGRFAPLYLIEPLRPVSVTLAVAGLLAFSTAGSVGPLAIVRGLEPTEVFRR